ncbi:MAG: NifU involved in Fe-S cluster formation [Nevskia sp.]|nr:NifU involved in Fe-S cluster formation [Nevskia sp.]
MSTELFLEALNDLAHSRGAPVAQPNAHALARNPLCGDQVAVALRVENDRIVAAAFEARGCVLCEAAASALRKNCVGQTLDALAAAESFLVDTANGDETEVPAAWSQLEVFAPLQSFPGRLKCVLLPLQALRLALQRNGANVSSEFSDTSKTGVST